LCKRISFVFILILLSIAALPVHAEVVSEEWKSKIEDHLQQVDENTTAEIVVYIVQSLKGHGIEKEGSEITEIVTLGVYIFNELQLDTPNGPVVGIGKKGKDNGVLILIAMEERAWRIEVGYGLEGDITDIESNLIAQQYLAPKFGEGKYGEGLYDTVVAFSQEIPTPSETETLAIRGRYFYENLNLPVKDEIPQWVIILIVVIFIVVIVIGIILAYLVKKGKIKMKSRGAGGRRGSRGSGGSRRPSRGPRGGGGRSGGGGSEGEW